MPVPANSIVPTPPIGEQPVALPGVAELFAKLVAGVAATPVEGEAAAAPDGEEPTATEAAPTEVFTPTDAALLLPLVEQQRSMEPAKIEAAAAGGQAVPAAGPVPATPAQAVAPAAVEGAGPVDKSAPTPKMPAAATAQRPAEGLEVVAKPLEAKTETANAELTSLVRRILSSGQAGPAVPTGGSPQPAPAASIEQVSPASPAAALAVQAQQPAEAVKTSLAAEDAAKALGRTSAAATLTTRVAEIEVAVRQADAAPSQPFQNIPAAAPLPVAVPTSAVPVAAAPLPLNLTAALDGQVLDMSRGTQWINTLAQEVVSTAASGSEGAMRFRLTPETLGELRVEITPGDRGAHVRMQVSSEAAQQALADAQPRLAAEARAQGVRIAETEISFTGGSAGEGREAGRQGQQQPDQPLRAFRHSADARPETQSGAGDPRSTPRRDRYA